MSKRWPDRLIIGLTGNIATGKSAVMGIVAERGALTLDADQIVHEILDNDRRAQGAIATIFGANVRLSDGRIDRDAVARIVFRDPEALRKLEEILHPHVRERLFERIEESNQPIVFIEAIKLLEGSLAAECDEIWVTRCPIETRIERLVTIRGMDREMAKMRSRAQPPQERKVALADVVIDTVGTMAATRAQVELAWSRLARSRPASMSKDDVPIASASIQRSLEKTELENDEFVVPSPIFTKGNEQDDKLDGVIVRRARPTDVPAILLLIQRATGGAVKMNRGELLLALGDRGYLIGQFGTEISTVAGWNAENQVASIDQIFITSAEAAAITGAAVLREIENTANELLCEVIIAFPLENGPPEIHELLMAEGFEYVDAQTLPKTWQPALSESRPENSAVMLKQLGRTRNALVRKVAREQPQQVVPSKS